MITVNGSMEWPNWEQYSSQPVYNTKAVVLQTGVPAPTLRAWERRYALLSPERANNAYRLYSERDIVLIYWLKDRVDAGMAISHAVELYHHRCKQSPAASTIAVTAKQREALDDHVDNVQPSVLTRLSNVTATEIPAFQVAVNTPNPSTFQPSQLSAYEARLAPTVPAVHIHWENSQEEAHAYPLFFTLQSARESLIEIFQDMDELRATILMGRLFALYSVEQICTELITPTLWEIGRLWATEEVTVSVEHFATNFFYGLLTNMLHVTPIPSSGPLVICGCAPGEPHELAALMVSLFLRRSGLRVAYLGQSIETTALLHTIQRLVPAMVCISLTLPTYMLALENLGRLIQNFDEPRPIFAFGGQAFRSLPQYAKLIKGIYCEGDLREVTEMLRKQVLDKGASIGR